MKKLITFFIKYPVTVNVLILGVFIMGYMGMKSMTSSFFPLSESTIINIKITYPGASPSEIEEGIVLKIEDNLRGLVGVDRVTSKSSENSALITVETIRGHDINVILAEVKNAVDRVPSFPSDMEPPIISKKESVRRTMSFAITGKGIDLYALKHIAREVETDLLSINNISQLSLSGFPAEEIEIALHENDLRAYNLTFAEVANAVRNSNLLSTGGNIKTQAENFLIRAKNKRYYARELDFIVVRTDVSGNIIRLKDIASVKDKWSEIPDRIYSNQQLAINIDLTNTNSEDMIKAADSVLDYVESFNKKHDNVIIDVTYNSSVVLKERTELLLNNGMVGILLVLIFLSLFLMPRLALWVAFGMPVSFLGMFMMAAYFGVTINVLSLFGMIIVIGILVDDGIVIAENIYHHSEMGKSPIQAAIDGTLEVIPPIISALLTTVIAFSTFFFLDGKIGDFFGEVSIIVTLTLLVSLVEAFLILPAHIAHSGALSKNKKIYKFNIWAESIMSWMRDILYVPILKFMIHNKVLAFSIPIAMLIFTIGGVKGGIIKTTFFPAVASDKINIKLAMPQGTNEIISDSIISFIEKKAIELNQELTEKQTGGKTVIVNFSKRIGPGTANASLNLHLLAGDQRDFSADEIANRLKEKVGEIYGAESVSYGSGTVFGGRNISISLIGNNIKELKSAKIALKTELQKNALLKDISDNDPAGIKEVKIKLKDNAYLLGFTLNSVMAQVRGAFFGAQAQRFQRGRDEVRVWVRYDIDERKSLKSLDEMQLKSPSGERVAFQEIATYEIERGEIAINHTNGKREIKVEASLKNQKESASDILEDLKMDFFPDLQAKNPSVAFIFEGQNREASKVQGSAKKVFPIILLLIYIVIAFTFRSYSQPFLLIIMVPFSFIGVGWGHYFHGFPVNILSWLGIIALVGIMVNDGLVLIQKFNINLKDGLKFDEALINAGKSRFRAIFLTSLTTVAGLAPLMFETSRQAQFLIPMAISIAYGITIATFLTLLTLPSLLYVNNTVKRFLSWLWTGTWPTQEEVENAIIEEQELEH